MLDRARKYMGSPAMSPGHATPDSNGYAHTPRIPSSPGIARRLSGSLATPDAAVDGSGGEGSEVDRKQRELYNKQQHLLREQRTADQDRLLSSISGAHCGCALLMLLKASQHLQGILGQPCACVATASALCMSNHQGALSVVGPGQGVACMQRILGSTTGGH